MLKVVFFGSGDFVKPVTDNLKENFELTQIISSKNFSVDDKPDIGVVANFGAIIKKETMDRFPNGILNIHPSFLPKYRGPTPVQTAIINGETKSGVSIIKIDEEVDHGPILFQKEETILPSDTALDLLFRFFRIGGEALPDVIKRYISNQIDIAKQDDSKATFTKTLTKKNGFIDSNNPPDLKGLDKMIRAYFPWPGVFTKFNLGGNEKIIKLLPNKTVQVEGKNPMSYKDFINGYEKGEEFLSKLSLLDL